MNQKERGRLIKKLDVQFSRLVRQRDGLCLWCGSTENLQCAHIISRTHYQFRWDFSNAITLCLRCHIYRWHKEPLEAAHFLATCLPEVFKNWERNKTLRSLSKIDLMAVQSRMFDDFALLSNEL